MSYGIIFDMDGLLIDSEPLHKEAEARLFAYLGCEGKNLSQQTFGMKAEDALLFLKQKLKFSHSLEEARAFWQEQIESLFKKKVEFMPSARMVLENLKNAGFSLGLCSSSPRSLIELALTQLGIMNYFLAVVSGDDVKKGKPDPEIYYLRV